MNVTTLTIVLLCILSAGLLIATLLLARRSSATPRPDTPATQTRAHEPSHPRADDILDRVREGVVVLDEELKPVLINTSARTMLGIQQKGDLARLPSEEVLATARKAVTLRSEVEELLTLWFPLRSRLQARATPLGGAGVVVLLQDVTEEFLAQKVRKEFVAHASHELKSPVAGLQTLAEAVQQAVEDDPAAAVRFSEKMMTETSRLGRLVSDLLDLSRLEDPVSIPEEPIDISRTAEWEMEQAEPAARAKNMHTETKIEPDVWVRGDEQQLGVMIRNLLENAIRYTGEGGAITLEVKRDRDQALITISDTGIGIPQDAQARVFERFYRVDRARSRDRGGTGLGLAIVKHVAELHGGNVSVTSDLGEGSTFTATIPAIPTGRANIRSIAG